jgi:transposase-like protein
MSKGRFAEEFKQEAVRQVVERGTPCRMLLSVWVFRFKACTSV